MRLFDHPLGKITFYEPGDDTLPVDALLSLHDTIIAADTETNHTGVYLPDFTMRLMQLGSANEAHVWQPEHFPELTRAAVTTREFYGHNIIGFDLPAIERACGVPLSDMAPYAVDTGILSRLHDSRGKKEGQVGHDLDSLAEKYLGTSSKSQAQKEMIAAAQRHVYRDIPEVTKGMSKDELKEIARLKRAAIKVTKDNVWGIIPVDDPTYLTYAGQDVLVAARLGEMLRNKIIADGLGWLAEFEHRVAYICASIGRRGIAIDRSWIDAGRVKYTALYEAAEATLRDVYGVTKAESAKSYANATASLTERLLSMGATLTKTTDSGKLSLDASVLKVLAAAGGDAGGLAQTVLDAKEAQHYGDGYLASFVELLGYDGRVHPKINPLAAVTGRMSITDPPLQQMPRDDKTLRGSFVPDPGHVFISADYSQVEWRVAAAVTRDPALLDAIHTGKDIHSITAAAVFGEDFTPGQRTDVKPLGLGVLYGLGLEGMAKALAKVGIAGKHAKRVRNSILDTYPGIGEFMAQAKATIEANGERVTEFRTQIGRKFLTDRGYLVLNYFCQSQARDLFAEALVKMCDAGLGDNVRLLVHDEVVLSVPADEVDKWCAVVDDCMNTTFMGVPITATCELLGDGARWQK